MNLVGVDAFEILNDDLYSIDFVFLYILCSSIVLLLKCYISLLFVF